MIDIDFLPIQYHQKNAYRQAKPWQIIVVTSFLGLVALLTISQKIHRRFVERELDELAPAYETAMAQEQRLADVQNQLKRMESEAKLITYLHHPWPRSQLLSALLSRLPEEITLEQLQITREADNSAAASDRRPAIHLANSGDQQKTLSPAERDLQILQNQSDDKQTVVILIGSTTDSAAVHRFLNEILSNPLFSKAELGSVTSVNESSGTTIQFQAKLVVKPGYGQPGGPADDQKTSRLQSNAGNDYANN
jgi:DNA mismatch repair ATPase MutS